MLQNSRRISQREASDKIIPAAIICRKEMRYTLWHTMKYIMNLKVK